MSGTSLDGIDAVLAEITPEGAIRFLSGHYLPYPSELRQRLIDLHVPQENEIHLAALAARELAHLYADAIRGLLAKTSQPGSGIRAIGCHGQTLRHRPDLGYSLQIGDAALLTELSKITVVANFRSRDLAAGGQGAPLVPAFHAHVLHHPRIHRVIVNIGGIANVTDLPPRGPVRGWDTGPGNMLMDAWIQVHREARYDKAGAWAHSGTVNLALLDRLLAHEYLRLPPPKSTGRDEFHLAFLQNALETLSVAINPVDVQATLLELTAQSLCQAIMRECTNAQEIYICGGGVHNEALLARIATILSPRQVNSTAVLGIDPDWMEALAFAWLARQTLHGLPGNLPEATGASGERILGAIYPV